MFKRLSLVLIAMLSFAIFTPTPISHAQVTWNVQFYNNPYLLDAVVATTTSSSIAVDWGSGAPWASVNADNWSARFTTSTAFTAGTYRFYLLADDGVQLHIDGTQILSTFSQDRAGQLQTVDVTLSQGNHSIQIDYQEFKGLAYLYVTWANVASNPSPPNFAAQSAACNVQYYNNPLLSGSPTVVTTQASPNNNWGLNAPISGIGVDNWSARWTCNRTLQGTYQVTAKADDGVRVFVNGIPYIDEWHTATGQTYTNQFTIPLGTYHVVVEYFEQTGSAFLEFNLSSISSGSGIWQAQYYDNINLSGNPAATVNENDPSHNWGAGAPLANIPADHFSARWSSTQNLNAGTYEIRVRADDGVRVFVDGNLVLNEWHDATGQTYTTHITLAAGNHSFVVEYYEKAGNAFLEYSLTRVDTPPTAPPSSTGATATINTSRLNVRNAPNRFTGAVLTRVSRGEVYAVVGRNQDSTWWQLNVNGTLGWVNGQYVLLSNTGGVPVVDSGAQDLPANTGFTLTTSVRVNMRSAPSTQAVIVGVFSPDSIGQIVGRSADNRWFKINFNDLIGWVSADFVTPQQALDFSRIPVVPI